MQPYPEVPDDAGPGFAFTPPDLDRPGFRWTADLTSGSCMDVAIEARVARGVWVRGWEAHVHGFGVMFSTNPNAARAAVSQACGVLHRHFQEATVRVDMETDAETLAVSGVEAAPNTDLMVSVPNSGVRRLTRRFSALRRVGTAAALTASRLASAGFDRAENLSKSAVSAMEHRAVHQALRESSKSR